MIIHTITLKLLLRGRRLPKPLHDQPDREARCNQESEAEKCERGAYVWWKVDTGDLWVWGQVPHHAISPSSESKMA
jgi:hypothetical protein